MRGRALRDWTEDGLIRAAVVASFFPDVRGGAEVGLRHLAPALPGAGAEPLILSLTAGRGAERIDALPARAWRLLIAGAPGLDGRVARLLERRLRAERVDVLHAWDSYCTRGVVSAATQLGIPCVVSYHNNVGLSYAALGAPRPAGAWLRRRERRVLAAAASADAVVAISGFVRDGLEDAGIPAARLRTIYLDGAAETVDRPKAPAAGTPFHVVCAGRLQEHKGFATAVDALRRLRDRGLAARLSIAGWGPDATRLGRLAATEDVRLLGRLGDAELVELLDSAHAVVVPTLTPEPFGRVAVEAATRGRAVVVSDHGGLREIADGGAGLRFPPGDAAALAAVLETLALDSGLRERTGAAALERCRRLFAPGTIAAQLAAVYAEVSAARPAAALEALA